MRSDRCQQYRVDTILLEHPGELARLLLETARWRRAHEGIVVVGHFAYRTFDRQLLQPVDGKNDVDVLLKKPVRSKFTETWLITNSPALISPGITR